MFGRGQLQRWIAGALRGLDAQATLPRGQALVGRRSQFRWAWMATRLHTFIVATPFPAGTATRATLDSFLNDATEFSIANKTGLPRGLQTGTAVLVVAVTEHAIPEAVEWAAKPHGRRFAMCGRPMAHEISSRGQRAARLRFPGAAGAGTRSASAPARV